MALLTTEQVSSHGKESVPITKMWMKHRAKWKMPDTKVHILYDSTSVKWTDRQTHKAREQTYVGQENEDWLFSGHGVCLVSPGFVVLTHSVLCVSDPKQRSVRAMNSLGLHLASEEAAAILQLKPRHLEELIPASAFSEQGWSQGIGWITSPCDCAWGRILKALGGLFFNKIRKS
jgi:hypothetical protein